MPRNSNKYQYETSPRKLEPEYTPARKKQKDKKSTVRKKETGKQKKIKAVRRRKRTIVAYILLGFLVLFAISYRSSQIDETFGRIQALRQQVAEIERESVQLEIAIASSTNLRNIEEQARELLGMQMLNSNQIVYVELPKSDHIESATEVVIGNNNTSMFRRIINEITNMFK